MQDEQEIQAVQLGDMQSTPLFPAQASVDGNRVSARCMRSYGEMGTFSLKDEEEARRVAAVINEATAIWEREMDTLYQRVVRDFPDENYGELLGLMLDWEWDKIKCVLDIDHETESAETEGGVLFAEPTLLNSVDAVNSASYRARHGIDRDLDDEGDVVSPEKDRKPLRLYVHVAIPITLGDTWAWPKRQNRCWRLEGLQAAAKKKEALSSHLSDEERESLSFRESEEERRRQQEWELI